MRADHSKEAKSLRASALSATTVASAKSSQLLQGKIDAVLIKKDRELEELKSHSEVTLKNTVQNADDEMKTILSKHKDELKLLRGEATVTAFEEFKSICPTLFTKKTQEHVDVSLVCKDLDSYTFPVDVYNSNAMISQGGSYHPAVIPRNNNLPQRFTSVVGTVTVLSASVVIPFFFLGWRLKLIPPLRMLLRKTPLVINVAKRVVFKPLRGVIGIGAGWLKGYLPM